MLRSTGAQKECLSSSISDEIKRESSERWEEKTKEYKFVTLPMIENSSETHFCFVLVETGSYYAAPTDLELDM